MTEIAALAYADTRSAINAIRDIRRNRGRLILWLCAAAIFGSWLVLRAYGPPRHSNDFGTLAQCDVLTALTIGAFGFFLARGSRFTGLFANPTEGRWIISLPVSPFAATIYVQLRELIRGGARLVLSVAFMLAFYLPSGISGLAVARDVLFELLALLATGAVLLPRRLAHGPVAAVCTVAGYACLAVAAVPLLRDASIAFHLGGPLARLRTLPAWHPGIVLMEPVNGHSIAIAAGLVAIAASALVALGLAARDALPELYALSIERIERGGGRRINLLRLGLGTEPRRVIRRPSVVSDARVPSGVAVFVWKAWTEYRRRTSSRATVVEGAGLLVAGYVTGRMIAHAHPSVWIGIAATVGQLVIGFSSLTAGMSVAAEIRRPLFWLSDASLSERLAALLAARVWRAAAWFFLFAIGLASSHAPLAPTLFAAVTGPALLVLCIAIGFAAFALFPNEVDQRGPLAVLRMLLSYVFVLPTVVAGSAGGLLLHSAPAGLATMTIVALTETGMLLGLAAWRLDTALPA